MPKRKTKRPTRVKTTANLDAMGQAVSAFLNTQGWDAFVVGPCEVRVPPNYANNQKTHDASGATLGQYEFIAKFYGRRTPKAVPSV